MAMARPEMAKAHSSGQSEAAPWVIVIPLCVPRPVRAKALYMVFSHGWSQQRHKGTHCVSTCLCAIYDLCKTRFTSRVGGLRLFIIVWLFILLCGRGYGGKVTIYLRNDKGNGEKIFEGGRRGNVKQRVVIEARWITNAAITAILQYCNNCNKHYSV